MASDELLLKSSAAKELEALPRKERVRVAGRLRGLRSEPRPQGSEKLSGHELYRIHQGDYRIVYEVSDQKGAVTVFKIGHRRDVHR